MSTPTNPAPIPSTRDEERRSEALGRANALTIAMLGAHTAANPPKGGPLTVLGIAAAYDAFLRDGTLPPAPAVADRKPAA
jgi:hypothetical protein